MNLIKSYYHRAVCLGNIDEKVLEKTLGSNVIHQRRTINKLKINSKLFGNKLHNGALTKASVAEKKDVIEMLLAAHFSGSNLLFELIYSLCLSDEIIKRGGRHGIAFGIDYLSGLSLRVGNSGNSGSRCFHGSCRSTARVLNGRINTLRCLICGIFMVIF